MTVDWPKHTAQVLREANRTARDTRADAFRRLILADKPNEECGVFGVAGAKDASAIVALGLHALQHRGQESAGVISYDGERFHSERRLGLVSDGFAREATMRRLAGDSAIGHVRYSTQGETILRNVQPLYADVRASGIAVANNGNLTNARALRNALVDRGCIFQSTTDTELFLQLAAISEKTGVVERFIDALRAVEGAYAVVALTDEGLIGARDPIGIRPLVIGDYFGAPVLCSETCALDAIGATYVRDAAPGEVVWCTDREVKSFQVFPKVARARPCAFEFVYFARADSMIEGRSVYEVRQNLGRVLAAEHPVEADVVSPVPDTGTPAAMGFAEAAKLPFEFGLIRNNYVGRTFIQPTQNSRELGVHRKHAANKPQLAGKRVVLIDDSIVRGTTSRKIVDMVRKAGAREVHMRIASPPITHPCFYGIDMPAREDLVGANHTVQEIADMIGVDSLGYLSVDGLYQALGHPGRDPHAPAFTDHYFTGDYPTPLTDRTHRENGGADAQQMSFLNDTD